MKSYLVFKLPEDAVEFKTACDGSKLYSVIWEMTEYLRSQLKYNTDLSEEAQKTLDSVKEKLYSILEDQGINIHDYN